MKSYSSYNDSGVEWIGKIPSGWEIKPLYSHFHHNRSKNDGSTDIVLSLSYGRLIERNVERNFGLLPDSFESYQLLQKGDIILRMTDLQNDKRSLRVGLCRFKGIITSVYIGLRSIDEVDSNYYYNYLHFCDLKKVFYGLGGGIRQSVTYNDFKRFPIPLPPLQEQQQISNYLDHKTGQIDILIEKTQQKIELLKEQRTSLINRIVTKGLNPNVEMKDSGVEWIGEIPSGWDVLRLKYYVEFDSGFSFKSNDFVSDGIPLIKIGNLYQNQLDVSRSPSYLPTDFLRQFDQFRIEKDDILISLTGTLGKKDYGFSIKYELDYPCLLNQRVGRLRPNSKFINWEFLCFQLLHIWNFYLMQLF